MPTESSQCVYVLRRRGAWCVFEPDSCPPGASPQGADWDYCPQSTTLAGCKCRSYRFENTTYFGTCNNADGDPLGAWCVVDTASCPSSARAHGPGAMVDYDYCQTRTRQGCFCSNSWSFGGTTYNGTCRTGACVCWCIGDYGAGCALAQHLGGFIRHSYADKQAVLLLDPSTYTLKNPTRKLHHHPTRSPRRPLQPAHRPHLFVVRRRPPDLPQRQAPGRLCL
jgi:hypothetical protein